MIKSSTQTLSIDTSEDKPESLAHLDAMVTLAYISIFLEVGATLSAIRMIDALGKLAFFTERWSKWSITQRSVEDKTP
ncbi:hypothetical protein FRB90_010216, partial [Tulasnella sp. 427]